MTSLMIMPMTLKAHFYIKRLSIIAWFSKCEHQDIFDQARYAPSPLGAYPQVKNNGSEGSSGNYIFQLWKIGLSMPLVIFLWEFY